MSEACTGYFPMLATAAYWRVLWLAIGPAYFTVANARPRLAALEADPWEDFRKADARWQRGSLRRAV